MPGEKPRRPTIDDVATRAGVSSAAVSFAVNGRPGVGEETRRRILAAVEELGWRPSASARALTEARARAIGLLLARSLDQLEVDPRFDVLAAARVPAVLAGHPVSECPFPWVETEHAAGMRLVVEHLLALGHREIAFVGGPAHYEHVQARLAVWRETLEGAGVEPGPVAHAPQLLDGVTA